MQYAIRVHTALRRYYAELGKIGGRGRYSAIGPHDIVYITMEQVIGLCDLHRWDVTTYIMSRIDYVKTCWKKLPSVAPAYKFLLGPKPGKIYREYKSVSFNRRKSMLAQMTDSIYARKKLKLHSAQEMLLMVEFLSPYYIASCLEILHLYEMGIPLPPRVDGALNKMLTDEELRELVINCREEAERKVNGKRGKIRSSKR